MKPIKILQSRNSGPYAFRTRLGLCIVRAVNGNSKNYVSCNKIAVRRAVQRSLEITLFKCKKKLKNEMLNQIHNHDFTEFLYVVDKKVALMSQEDKKFFHILNEGTRLKGGHCEIPQPFRNEDVALPSNRVHIERRF